MSKPHIRLACPAVRRYFMSRYCCGVQGEYGLRAPGTQYGFGNTPAEAYADYRRRNFPA